MKKSVKEFGSYLNGQSLKILEQTKSESLKEALYDYDSKYLK